MLEDIKMYITLTLIIFLNYFLTNLILYIFICIKLGASVEFHTYKDPRFLVIEMIAFLFPARNRDDSRLRPIPLKHPGIGVDTHNTTCQDDIGMSMKV
jgi:hypothetical protein